MPDSKEREDQDSRCRDIPNEECEKRKDCKLPDGTRCPAYPKPSVGGRFV